MIITANFIFRVDNNPLAEQEIETIINAVDGFSVRSVETYNSTKCEETGDPDFDNDYDFYISATFTSTHDLEKSTELLKDIYEFLEIASYSVS